MSQSPKYNIKKLQEAYSASGRFLSFFFKYLLSYFAVSVIGIVLTFAGGFAAAQECPSQKYKRSSQTPIVKDMVNPHPSKYDFELPMPCGGKLFLRHVCILAKSFLNDVQVNLGCEECRRRDEGFMEARRVGAVAGAFTLEELPEPWQVKLIEIGRSGDGLCPPADDEKSKPLYYFIGKYEISNWQWQTVMDDDCPGWDKAFTTEDPRPKTNISWFEAIEFTRRYTQWLLKNRPDTLPEFPAGRHGYIRLPTEAEWEYAARGGHMTTIAEMNREDFFPLNNRHLSDFAQYTRSGAAKPPERLAWIGTKCPNPLDMFDTAGNAAEIMFDPFRFSIGSRLHGATGGFVIKGGSYRKSRAEIMPGRREEMPFFLDNDAYRSGDLGLRVVLSGIVTPRNRIKALRQQWTKIAERSRLSQLESTATKPTVDMDYSKNLILEIERRATDASSDIEKEKLLSEANYIKELTSVLADQQANSIKTLIWKALFSLESLLKYTLQSNELQHDLKMLKKMKAEPLPESEIESIDKDISGLMEQISHGEVAIDYLTQSYIANIQNSGRFSQDAIERQLDRIFQDQILDENLRSSLNGRIEVFRNHMSLYTAKPESIQPETITGDILSKLAP